MTLEILPQAQRDVVEAANYYGRLRAGLDDEFLAEVTTAFESILAQPHLFEQVRRGMRRYLLKQFPYSVCYRIRRQELVEVVVVKHHSRRPGFGERRK